VEFWVPAERVPRTPQEPGFRKPPVRFSFRYSASVIQFQLFSFRYLDPVIYLPLSSFSCLVFVIQIPLFNLRYLVLAIQICYLVFSFGIVIRFSFRHSVSGIRVSFVRSSPVNQLLFTLVLVLLGSLLAIVRICHGKMFRSCFSGMWFLQFP